MVEHAAREAPNECCGYLRARDGAVDEVTEARNARNSPYGYELDGPALLTVNELDDDGWRYLSSGVYTKPIEELEEAIETTAFW